MRETYIYMHGLWGFIHNLCPLTMYKVQESQILIQSYNTIWKRILVWSVKSD